jgi:NADH:ubiquinone oxidoreductase subunit E
MIKKVQIKICLGSSCFSRGNQELVGVVQKYLRARNIEDKVAFTGDHCSKECLQGPNIRIDGKVFKGITEDNIYDVLDKNLKDIL